MIATWTSPFTAEEVRPQARYLSLALMCSRQHDRGSAKPDGTQNLPASLDECDESRAVSGQSGPPEPARTLGQLREDASWDYGHGAQILARLG